MNLTAQDQKNGKKNSLHFDWLLPTLFRPRSTIQNIVASDKSSWLSPLLVVSFLIILATLIAAPIRRNVIQMGLAVPVDFQYYSTEQQTAFLEAQASQTSPLFLYVFPILIGLASLWAAWFILSSMLHLSLTLTGSRASSIRSFNLAGWSFLPLAIRQLVRILAMIFSKTLIASPGLSGFIPADASGIASYFGAILGLVDIFFIWQIILLMIGVLPLSGLTKRKAWVATGISLFILVLLQALPGFISNALGGLSLTRPFFF
jgi:hypothetical protein